MSTVELLVQFYKLSKDLGTPVNNKETHKSLSQLLSQFENLDDKQPFVEENNDKTVWKLLSIEYPSLPNSQPSVSSINNFFI